MGEIKSEVTGCSERLQLIGSQGQTPVVLFDAVMALLPPQGLIMFLLSFRSYLRGLEVKRFTLHGPASHAGLSWSSKCW